MFDLIIIIAYFLILGVCLLFVVGLAYILWDDVNAERKYLEGKRDDRR